MSDNENYSAPYIGHSDCPRPVPPILVRSLWGFAIVLVLAATMCMIFRSEAAVSIPFLIFGPFLLLAYLETKNKRAVYSRYTNGRVVDKITKLEGRHYSILPIIEYEVDGKTYRVEGNRHDPDYALGDEAWVYFDPNSPSQAVQEFSHTHMVSPILGGIAWGVGVILLVCAVLI